VFDVAAGGARPPACAAGALIVADQPARLPVLADSSTTEKVKRAGGFH
jgi:hypothetical protein